MMHQGVELEPSLSIPILNWSSNTDNDHIFFSFKFVDSSASSHLLPLFLFQEEQREGRGRKVKELINYLQVSSLLFLWFIIYMSE